MNFQTCHGNQFQSLRKRKTSLTAVTQSARQFLELKNLAD